MEPSRSKEVEVKEMLLHLIEDGDPAVILSSEYTESLNEFIKYEFVHLENERLRLTEKGQLARLQGLQIFYNESPKTKFEKKLTDFPEEKWTQDFKNQSFLIIFFFFLTSLVIIIFLMNL